MVAAHTFVALIIVNILYAASILPSGAQVLFPSANPTTTQKPQQECGKINQKYLYNREKFTAFDEYPWIGRVSYTNGKDDKTFSCLGVLYTRRHLIAPAHCILTIGKLEAYSVVFGDWNATNEINQHDCNAAGDCAPLPQEHEFEEIAVHPNYDRRKHNNDIAVLKINRDVSITDYVRPICLLPAIDYGDFIAQRLELVGFSAKSLFNLPPNVRQKAIVHTTSRQHCSNIYKGIIVISNEQICGYVQSDVNFLSGTALMGVEVINGEPLRMFLIGIATVGSRVKNYEVPDLFMRVYPYKDWILNNSV